MIGAYAPYGHTDEMIDDWAFLASKNLRGFIAHSNKLSKTLMMQRREWVKLFLMKI